MTNTNIHLKAEDKHCWEKRPPWEEETKTLNAETTALWLEAPGHKCVCVHQSAQDCAMPD